MAQEGSVIVSGDPLDKYRRRRSPGGVAPDEQTVELKAGELPVAPTWIGDCLRVAGQAKPAAVVLRQREGTRTALTYGYLSSVRLDPEGSVDLEFVGHQATLKGRRLNAVFEALSSQQAMEIAEALSPTDDGSEAPFIQTISIVATQEH